MSRSTYDARNINIPQPASRALGGLRQGLSSATNGYLGANDLRLNNLSALGGPDSRGYSQRREDRIRQRVEGSRELLANEQTQMTVNYNVQNPNGTFTPAQRRVSAEEAQREYNRHRAEVEQREGYSQYVSDRDSARQNLTQAQRDFEVAEREHRVQQTAASQQALTAAQTALNNQRQALSDAQTQISRIENMWRQQRDFANRVQQQLQQQQREFYENYAQSIRDWNPTGITGIGEANREAANRIEDQSFPNRGR
jgi:phage-related minor tail protein